MTVVKYDSDVFLFVYSDQFVNLYFSQNKHKIIVNSRIDLFDKLYINPVRISSVVHSVDIDWSNN